MWDALDDSRDASGYDQAGGDAGEHCLAKSRFVKTADEGARHQLAVQVRYIAVVDPRDPPEQEPRQLFTAGRTNLTRAEARGLIWNNRSVKGVLFHRIILSPSRGLGITTAAEAQDWTRATLAELGKRLDRDLAWIAGAHTNRDHVHVHVLVAGEAGQVSTSGARRVVRLGRDDLTALRTRLAIDAARPIREARQARAQATHTALLHRDLDAMVYRPAVTPTHDPQPTIVAVGRKEKPRESLISRLFRRGA